MSSEFPPTPSHQNASLHHSRSPICSHFSFARHQTDICHSSNKPSTMEDETRRSQLVHDELLARVSPLPSAGAGNPERVSLDLIPKPTFSDKKKQQFNTKRLWRRYRKTFKVFNFCVSIGNGFVYALVGTFASWVCKLRRGGVRFRTDKSADLAGLDNTQGTRAPQSNQSVPFLILYPRKKMNEKQK